MKTQHTPGPWVAHHYGIRDRGGYICELRWPQHYEGQDARFEQETAEREGDARLIAAAPDLLAACEAAKKFLEPDLVEPGRTVFWRLVDALKKAGQS